MDIVIHDCTSMDHRFRALECVEQFIRDRDKNKIENCIYEYEFIGFCYLVAVKKSGNIHVYNGKQDKP